MGFETRNEMFSGRREKNIFGLTYVQCSPLKYTWKADKECTEIVFCHQIILKAMLPPGKSYSSTSFPLVWEGQFLRVSYVTYTTHAFALSVEMASLPYFDVIISLAQQDCSNTGSRREKYVKNQLDNELTHTSYGVTTWKCYIHRSNINSSQLSM